MFGFYNTFINDQEDHPNSSTSFYSPISSTDSFITSGIIIDNNPSLPANPHSPLISSIELEQLQQSQSRECLETSASYMQDIESFFRELTSTNTKGSQCQSVIATPQPPTPISAVNTLTSCIVNFDALDLDHFAFGGSNCDPVSVIDPSIFYSKSSEESDNESNSDDDDDEGEGDQLSESQSQSQSKFNLYNWDEPYNPPNKRKTPRSKNKSPDSNSTAPKPPKFYSRSGQVADPRRGPCHNCHTTLTCYWRKLKGQYHCNACTLYYKRNKCHRSGEDLGEKPIKRRNRKSKYMTGGSD